ncbi:MAG: hydantoinase/oxoprolinase N-terminal domain-containing protein, partial [Acetobacteraceae bacterium]
MNRLGIDVGGTNTDATLVADGRVLYAIKVPTTEDVTSGIVAAMRAVLAQAAISVDAVMIGTTHFVNAVVQRRSLAPVAAMRIGLPATAALPPFTDWPDDLAAPVAGGCWLVQGGHD